MSCKFENLDEQTKQFNENLKKINNTFRECLKDETFINSDEIKKLENKIGNLIKEWNNFRKELITFLELMDKISDEEGKKLLNKLREKLLVRSLSESLKRVENAGLRIGKEAQKDKVLQKAFERNRFKILENTRLENFDQVIYILERIFFSVEKQTIPLELIEILSDPSIAVEIKKSAVYLFLASFDVGLNSKKQN